MSTDPATRPPADSVPLPTLARTILQIIDTVVLVLDCDGRIQYLNPACEKMTGYEAEELRNEVVFERLIPEDARDDVRRYWKKIWNETADARYRNPWVTKSGDRCYLTWSNTLVETESGHRYVVATGTDISRRRDLERDVVQVSESEQQRIGQELHDTLASDLVAAAMKMDNLRGRLQKQHSETTDLLSRLENIETSVRQASKRARSLSHLLAAGQLEPSELPGALAELVKTYREASDVDCQLQVPNQNLSGHLDGSAAGHLYRIAQEAMRNAVRHGHPTHVAVQVEVVPPSQSSDANAASPPEDDPQERRIVLQVRDDGIGIPDAVPTDLHSANQPEAAPHGNDLDDGIGLRLMAYRADLIDATLTINTSDGGGTVVQCTLPVQQ